VLSSVSVGFGEENSVENVIPFIRELSMAFTFGGRESEAFDLLSLANTLENIKDLGLSAEYRKLSNDMVF
ncbi:MAG: hypothetical protein NZT61_00390, partial [Deltaproteobacteria bacterium]|nr:hypothetical protein [Deltaproteobacteria bacterium]